MFERFRVVAVCYLQLRPITYQRVRMPLRVSDAEESVRVFVTLEEGCH